MPLAITGFYAGILAIICMLLVWRVGAARLKLKVSLGSGGHDELLEKIRGHANFCEFVPLALILMAFLELNGVYGSILHTLGVILVISRIIHPFGLSAQSYKNKLRAAAIPTELVILFAAVLLIWQTSKALFFGQTRMDNSFLTWWHDNTLN